MNNSPKHVITLSPRIRFAPQLKIIRAKALMAVTLALAGVAPLAAQVATENAQQAKLPADSADVTATAAVSGSGTATHLTRWTGAQTLGNSVLIQNAANNIGIGDPNPSSKLTVSGADAKGPTIRGTNTAAGRGVAGTSASGIGVIGTCTSGIGVEGSVTGANNKNAGVLGQTSATADGASGVLGKVTSTSPGKDSAGVRGINNGDGATYGVYGTSANVGVRGDGIVGVGGSGTFAGAEVFGKRYGLFGLADPLDAESVGVSGTGKTGVEGDSKDGAGVRGTSDSSTGVSGQSNTGAGVTGRAPTISASTGSAPTATRGISTATCTSPAHSVKARVPSRSMTQSIRRRNT